MLPEFVVADGDVKRSASGSITTSWKGYSATYRDDMFRPMNRFTHRHVYSDNCSCPIAEHIGTMALIGLSCACKRTE